MDNQLIGTHILGAFCALLSAFMWAVSALMFARIGDVLTPKAMNMGKGLVALICLFVLLLVDMPIDIHSNTYWYLALSGLLGICIGDTLYFHTLRYLGPKLLLLVGSLIPVITAITSIILFEESLNVLSGFGLFLTLGGVTFVLWQKVTRQRTNSKRQIVWFSGLFFALLYILAESGGILFTKIGLNDYNAMEATFIRQVWGVAGLFVWGMIAKDLISDFVPFKSNPSLQRYFLATAFIGAFLGTWLSVLALEKTYAAVAVSLNSTSPLFVLVAAYWLYREKIDGATLLGAVFAVLGIMLYFLSLSL